MKKKIFIFVLFAFVFFIGFNVNGVEAKTFKTASSCYGWSSSGAYSSSGCYDYVKKDSDGKYAFCSEYNNHYTKSCSKQDSWKSQNEYAVVVGNIISIAKSKYSSTKRYGMTAMAINAYLSNYYPKSWGGNSKGSGKFAIHDGKWLKNEKIQSIVNTAIEQYKKSGLSVKSIKKPEIKVSKSIMNKLGTNSYISNKITLTGDSKVGDSAVNYTVSASTSNGSASICTGSNGTGCSSKVSFSGDSIGSKAFYVKVDNYQGTTKSSIKFTISGSNSTKYNTSVRYSCGSGKQHLVQADTGSLSRSVSNNKSFTILSAAQHAIMAKKTDEYGELLKGVNYSIYRTSDLLTSDIHTVAAASELKNKGTKVASNSDSDLDAEILYSYTAPSGEKDTFADYNYYLLEEATINGYVINRVRLIYSKGTDIASEREVCMYSAEDKEVSDMELCNQSNYTKICKSSTGELKQTDDLGSCNFESKVEDGTDSGNDGTTPEVTWNEVCGNISDPANLKEADSKYCDHQSDYVKVTYSGGSLEAFHVNEKNHVSVSKRAITGDDELSGAELKICSEADYKSKGNDCSAAKTIDNTEMSWISGGTSQTISGIPVGTYYIVETVAPLGYATATTATKFSIDVDGKVTSSGVTTSDSNLIVIKDSLTKFSVSKTDITTSKELSGASLSICLADKQDDGSYALHKESLSDSIDYGSDEKADDDTVNEPDDAGNLDNSSDTTEDVPAGKEGFGNCVPAVLADGSSATWTSNGTSHVVEGLSAGTYFLVENAAPKGYDKAEYILFTMNKDGSISDVNGNNLANNKIEMKDKPSLVVKVPSTSAFISLLVPIIGVLLILGGLIAYFLSVKNIKVKDVFNKLKDKLHFKKNK